MKKKPNLMTVMTPLPYSVQLGTLFLDTRKLMKENNVSHLPVMDAGTIVGVITSRNIRSRKEMRLKIRKNFRSKRIIWVSFFMIPAILYI